MNDREIYDDVTEPMASYGGAATPRGGIDTARETADEARQRADQLAEQAAAWAGAGKDWAAEELERVAGMLRDRNRGMRGADAAGAAQSVAVMAADQLEIAGRYIRGKDADQIVADLEALVRRRPVESVLVAAGVGFLLSKALRS